MPLRTTDRWRSKPRGTPEQAMATFVKWGSFPIEDVEDASREIYRLCHLVTLDAALLVAHAALETGDEDEGKGFLDENWATINQPRDPRNRYNIAGMGITDSQDLGYRWANGIEAARAFVVHHARYEIPANDPAWEHLRPYIPLDKRYNDVPAKNRGTVKTVAQMTGKWWTNTDGHVNLVSRGNAIYPNLPDQSDDDVDQEEPGKEPDMAESMKAYTFPGAPRSMFLPTALQVQVKIVEHSNVRSYQRFTGQTKSTFHDTGNPRTKAPGEYSWLAAGRPGGGAGGYQGIVDDTVLIIAVPFNEVTWAQGTPDGNRLSWAFELAFGGNTNWNKALDNACAVHAAALEMKNIPVSTGHVQHKYWYGKWCSAQVLNRGLEAFVINRMTYWWNVCRAVRNGDTQVPEVPGQQEWASPVMPLMADMKPWDGKADLVTASGTKFEAQRVKAKITANVNQRQWAGPDSLFTGPGYKAGDEVEFLGWVQGELVENISEWWIDTKGSRIWGGCVDAEPKQDPEYNEHPETPPGVEYVNGRAYYPLHYDGEDRAKWGQLGREITIHRAGNLRKWATTDEAASPIVGEVKEDEVRVFKYWTRGEELPLVLKDGTEVTEGIWFAEDLHTGARMWSGLSEERPD